MLKLCLPNVLLPFIFSFLSLLLNAQERKESKDTSVLSGTSEHTALKVNPIDSFGSKAEKIVNPFLVYAGKPIRNIRFVQLGFERNIRDTTVLKYDFGVIMANGLHTKTKTRIIRNNLFFKEGDNVQPYLLADNERQLRDQVYIQDARILIDSIAGCPDSIDVVVITKDIFPLTAVLAISNPTKMRLNIRNESVAGSGSQVSLGVMYDKSRNPNFGYGAAFVKRNILGSFINWGAGFQTYNNAFNSGRREETYLYTIIERPFVTPYIPWMGSLSLASNKTNNYYVKDSLYNSDFKYDYRSADLWVGYNLSSKMLLSKNMISRVNKLVALRTFYQKFTDLPDKNRTLYDYRYADISGVLGSFNIFKQDVYRTKLLYGFGKNEDLIEGYSASIIAGWSVKENRGRPYLGTQLIRSHFSPSGFYTTFVFRMGGNFYNSQVEDANILLNVDHFTRLKKITDNWYNRSFFSAGFSHQINPLLDQPLQISSAFGLPYFRSILAYSSSRTTVKAESVFYNMRSFLGFKLAPFIFADMSMLTPLKEPYSKSQLYSAFGGGIRTGNDNLSIGTFELRAFYFPKTVDNMKAFRAEIGANIRFKYNGLFVLRPDFVIPN